MADDFNLVLEHLRHIRAKQDAHDRRFDRIEDELRSVNNHLGGFFRSINHADSDIAELKSRLERIEKRLDLHEPGH